MRNLVVMLSLQSKLQAVIILSRLCMYMGVIAKPDIVHGFDGKILLK
jgi:hypothetical protein